MTPNYKLIYSDILIRKFPHKREECKSLLNKESLSVVDIIDINQKIFGLPDKDTESFNQKQKSYKNTDILQILLYQRKHKLNNNQLANHFKLSRTTVTKWQKLFSI